MVTECEDLKPMHRPNRKRVSKSDNNMQQIDASIAPIIKELDLLFDNFNKRFFGSLLPKPVITLSQRGNKLGKSSCTDNKVWADKNDNRYFEINIYPVCLKQPVEDICEILLHEMVHLMNKANGVIDCSSGSQYHNKAFKKSAEEHGLSVKQSQWYGYSETSLKPETEEYIKSLDLSAFDLYRESEMQNAEKGKADIRELKKASSTRIYFCPECKTKIRATKEVRVRCDACNVLFQKC